MREVGRLRPSNICETQRSCEAIKLGFSHYLSLLRRGSRDLIYLEPDIEGSLVQDCEVCCNPWQLHVWFDGEHRRVAVTRADGSE